MSHFTVLVVLPPWAAKNGNLETSLEALLSQFDEDREVPTYHRVCPCVGRDAETSAYEQLNGEGTNPDLWRADFNEVQKNALTTHPTWAEAHKRAVLRAVGYPFAESSDETLPAEFRAFLVGRDAKWHQLHTARNARMRELKQADVRWDKPSTDCGLCAGTGWWATTYNPMAKWDWWAIGGRWVGALTGYDPALDPKAHEPCRICGGTGMRTDDLGVQERKTDPTYTCNGCHGKKVVMKFPARIEPPTVDVVPLRLLPPAFVPFAVVTPDGTWHQKGDMGCWGLTRNEKADDAWHAQFRQIVQGQMSEYVGVLVDCHI